MEKNWVDFRAVKESVSMQMALDHYGVNWLRKTGEELSGRCPIHKGEGTNTFHVSLSKNAFQCFSCKARGNVLDFVAAMEQCSVRDAAVKLAEWFSLQQAPTTPAAPKPTPKSGGEAETEAVNKPLTFQLKGIDHGHPYLAERGISRETAETFGVGYFSGRGSMSGQIVIPIHNERAELVAYAGRAIDGSEPKYKFPAGFHKSMELFNLHRISGSFVMLVEGFFDCMRVHQAEFPAAALMGSALSDAQEKLLLSKFDRVILMLDGDQAGQRATIEVTQRLSRKIWVRSIVLPAGVQPDSLVQNELNTILTTV